MNEQNYVNRGTYPFLNNEAAKFYIKGCARGKGYSDWHYTQICHYENEFLIVI